MKALRLLGLAGALAFGLHADTVVFDSANEPANPSNSDAVNGEGPLYDSFASIGGQISELQLVLSGDETSLGSVQVGLYYDNSGVPGELVGAEPLAVIPDSLLSSAPESCYITVSVSNTFGPCDITFESNPILTVGNYWIGLCDGSSSSCSGTSAMWYWDDDSDPSGVGLDNESFYNASTGTLCPTTGSCPDSLGPYQMQVTMSDASSSEPSTSLLIAAGIGLLGLLGRTTRRRTSSPV